jgi:putative ABC transport system permease protein
MAEEMSQHLAEITKSNIEDGMDPVEAQFAAQKRFGGIAQIEDRCRDTHGFVWIDQFRNDVRFTARSLCRSRGYTFTVLLTLILGIGVTTAVFEFTAETLIYRSPYPRPDELVCFGFWDKQNLVQYYSFGVHLKAYREQTNVFSEFAAVEGVMSNVVVGGEPLALYVKNATTDCFHTLGVAPVLGRAFLPEEHKPGKNDVVVISDFFWRKYFDAAPDVLGRTVLIDRRVCTIVGVLARSQKFPSGFEGDVFCPLAAEVEPTNLLSPGLVIIGRLKPGVTREQALASASKVKLPVLPAWASDYFASLKPILTPVPQMAPKENYWVIFLGATFLYAIACLNAMNLMVIRLLNRRRELSIRFSIGGSRLQVVQLLAIESLMLTSVASLSVLVVVRWWFPRLFVVISGNESWNFHDSWNPGTLCFIAGLSALACLAVVLIPAFRLFRTEINSGLKDGGPISGEGRGSGRLRHMLVVLQAAFAVVLLIGSGLMVRSFGRINRLDLGFDRLGKVKVQVVFPRGYDMKPEERLQLFERLKDRLGTLPGVKGASYSQDSIFQGYYEGSAELQLEDGTFVPTAGSFVSEDYQKTAGLVMKKGRWLTGKPGQFEAVINETFAKARFGDKDPVGLSFKIKIAGDQAIPVVGVVRDIHESVRSAPGVRFYAPCWIWPPNIDTVILRMDGDPRQEFGGIVRRAIYGVDPKLIVSGVTSIDELVDASMGQERLAFTILRGLSLIALGLAIVGVFSVTAYSVDRRMPEFGIRTALGATASDLRGLVLKRGLSAIGGGLVLGTVGAVGLTQFMKGLLFETAPYDPTVYVAVAGILLAVGATACWLPARRAAKVDVAKLLRSD